MLPRRLRSGLIFDGSWLVVAKRSRERRVGAGGSANTEFLLGRKRWRRGEREREKVARGEVERMLASLTYVDRLSCRGLGCQAASAQAKKAAKVERKVPEKFRKSSKRIVVNRAF